MNKNSSFCRVVWLSLYYVLHSDCTLLVMYNFSWSSHYSEAQQVRWHHDTGERGVTWDCAVLGSVGQLMTPKGVSPDGHTTVGLRNSSDGVVVGPYKDMGGEGTTESGMKVQ